MSASKPRSAASDSVTGGDMVVLGDKPTGEPDFDRLRKACEVVATRLGPESSEEGLDLAFAQMLEHASAAPPVASDLRPREPSGGEGSLQGTWVGAVGTGPGKITLTFYAREDGSFEYVLEAAGQSDSAGGTWTRGDGTLVLTHEDEEVETIPFRLDGETLFWTDDEIGELRLERSG